MFSILHISDLHRSNSHPVSNDALLDSILSDVKKYPAERPPIHGIDVIVVTGDLVSGAKIDDRNPRETLRGQYLQAKDFLVRLSKELLGADLQRLFIVPGNHDVSFCVSKSSMKRVDELDRYNVLDLLRQNESPYRWSWKELNLYAIHDVDRYEQRLSAFKAFFDDFYNGLGLSFNLETNKQSINYVTPDGVALLTGFSSLHGNDCFNHRGIISVEDVHANNLKIGKTDLITIPLKIAFWHHNIEGFGFNDDHLNSSEVLPNLIDHGYSIGLHGHQHRSQVVRYAYSLKPQLVMPVVACGSLCADPYDIPAGNRRQYNVIEIDEKKSKVRVHVREWDESQIWRGAMLPDFLGKTYVDLDLPILAETLARSNQQTDVRTTQNLLAAEIAFRNKDYDKAVILLRDLPRTILLVRRLLTEAYQMLGIWPELVELIQTPTNADELAILIDALLKLKDFTTAERVLSKFAAESGEYAQLVELLRKRLDTERRLAGSK